MDFISKLKEADKKKTVILKAGFGNRLNNILNYVDDLSNTAFFWTNDQQCSIKWEDIFVYPKLNIKYEMSNGLYLKGSCYFVEEDEKIKIAAKFIRSLLPSNSVKKEVIKLSEGTVGYYARLLSKFSSVTKPFKIPDGCFLATDHKLQRELNPGAIQTRATGSLTDIGECRSKENVILAVADWLTLMQCSKIYEIGTKFDKLDSKKHQSTFLYAHKIIGMDVINLTKEYENI